MGTSSTLAEVSPEQLLGADDQDWSKVRDRALDLAEAIVSLLDGGGSDAHLRDVQRKAAALTATASHLDVEIPGRVLKSMNGVSAGMLDQETYRGMVDALDAWTGSVARHSMAAPKPESQPPSEAARVLPMGHGPDRTFGVEMAARELRLALVCGKGPLEESLRGVTTPSEIEFETQSCTSVDEVFEKLRSDVPDLLLVDADTFDAVEIARRLLSEPRIDPVPMVVVGSWSDGAQAAPLVALGAAKTLSRPVSSESLHAACVEVVRSYVDRVITREPLGDVTVSQLGERLAEELRRGLSDAAAPNGRDVRVSLGDGAEILGALWGAVARVRDIVIQKSQGGVQFSASGPEGAIPMAPWLGLDEPRGQRGVRRSEIRSIRNRDLKGIRAIVADDDPATRWFVADVLRSAGAVVLEARDGDEALKTARGETPDVIVSDVLMPGLDGFGLCRAIKRDVALRDVPVVLLSWKEDLLQRVRELGADAEGYLRKEASGSSILARIGELMGPRQRIAERLREGGEVRGRLDGLTATTLVTIVARERPEGTLVLRDARNLFEVRFAGGAPVRAERTSQDGRITRGPAALRALLSLTTGRFVVSDPAVPKADVNLEGSIQDQLGPMLATLRVLREELSGSRLLSLQRVEFDSALLEIYVACAPASVARLLRRLADGASPDALVRTGAASPRILEDILADAADQGLVLAARDSAGSDRLAIGIERAIMALRGELVSVAEPAGEQAAGELLGLQDTVGHEELAEQVIVAEPSPSVVWIDPSPIESAPSARFSLSPPAEAASSHSEPDPSPEILLSVEPPPPARLERAMSPPSRFAPRPAPAPIEKRARLNSAWWWIAAAAGLLFALSARTIRERWEHKTPATEKPASVAGPANGSAVLEDAPAPASEALAAGQGILEVSGPSDAVVRIDGKPAGDGPAIKTTLAARTTPYEVNIRARGTESAYRVLVRPGRTARLVAP